MILLLILLATTGTGWIVEAIRHWDADERADRLQQALDDTKAAHEGLWERHEALQQHTDRVEANCLAFEAKARRLNVEVAREQRRRAAR